MAVVDQVVEQLHVALVHAGLELAEGDAGGVDDGGFAAEVVDQADPALAVEDFDMIGGGDVEVFHETFSYD